MIEINRAKFIWNVKEVWFSDKPHDIEGCDFLVFNNCKEKVEMSDFIRSEHQTLVIDMRKGIEDIWKNMSKSSCRYMINGAGKNNIRVIVNQKIEDFIKINKSFRRKKNLPALKLSVDFIKKNGILFVAELNGEVLGGQFYLTDKHNMRWLVGASKRLSEDKDKSRMVGMANRLLVWEAIKYGKKMGLINFDLGGYYVGNTDNEKISINRFKESFGGKVMSYYSYKKYYSKFYKILTYFRNIIKI